MSSIQLPITTKQIMEILPHRYPFMFVDEVTEFEDRVRIVGRKHVRPDEPYFQGHFPGRPIMPGVLILESLAQLGAIFAKISTGGVAADKLIVFAGADDVRFRRPVYPGDVLTLKLGNHRQRGPHWRMEGEVYVGEEKAADAIIKANEVA
jgi:beta-hydroxyacyl-ACP dehydratase FabZ